MSILKLRVTAIPPVGLDGSSVIGTNLSNQQVDENFLSLEERKLAKSGGTMTGFIVLHSDPTLALHPATKQSSEAAAAAAITAHNAAGTSHVATSVSVAPTGAIAATNVQAALAELDTEKLALAGGTLTGALTLAGAPTVPLHAATKAYVDASVPALAASGVTVTPAGGIAATNVQAALQELDAEKQPNIGYTPVNVNGDDMLGVLTVLEPTTAGLFNAVPKAYTDVASLWRTSNPLINAGFLIWQKGTSFTGSGTTRVRTADAWWARVLTGTGSWAVSRVSVVGAGFDEYGGGKWALKLQRPNGNTGLGSLQIGQSVESLVAEAYSQNSMMLSICVRLKKGANYSGGAVRVLVKCGTGTDQNVLDTYTGESTLLDWNITPTTDYTTYSNQFAVSSTMTEFGIVIQYTPTGTASSDDSIYIQDTWISRSVFDEPTLRVLLPFAHEPFVIELLRCKRYYETSFPYGTTPSQNGSYFYPLPCFVGGVVGPGYYPVNFLSPKRTLSSYTLTTFNPAAASNQARNITRNTNGSGTGAQMLSSLDWFVLSWFNPSGTVAGDVMGVGWEYSDNNF